jgi:hypothetical protein
VVSRALASRRPVLADGSGETHKTYQSKLMQ